MIRITCTTCKSVLSIDDAFAGGVCRCQHCGTIQTVPAQAKDGPSSGAIAQAASRATQGKALFQHKSRSGESIGTGLDQLADAVASSGLSGSGLTDQRLRKPSKTPAAAALPAAIEHKRLRMLLGIAASVIFILLLIILWLLIRGANPPTGIVPDAPINLPATSPSSVKPTGI